MDKNIKTLGDIIDQYNEEFKEKLDKLQEEAKADIAFGDMDEKGTHSEIIRNISNYQKWVDKLAKQEQLVKRAYNALNRIYGSLYEDCRSDRVDIAMRGRSEIDSWICRQPKYAKAKSYLNDLETIQKFMERTIENLKNRNYSIKNIMENRRFFQGE
jgi:hypothetical protein